MYYIALFIVLLLIVLFSGHYFLYFGFFGFALRHLERF